MRMRRAAALRACVVALALWSCACGYWTERRLVGQWRTEATPERTLDLYADGSFSLRLSGKGLGFVSELLGPETGAWRVERRTLVLTHKDSKGVETTQRWPINELRHDHIVLAAELWQRVTTAPARE